VKPPDSHWRLGWCTNLGELQAPVGYDKRSYGYRDIGGMSLLVDSDFRLYKCYSFDHLLFRDFFYLFRDSLLGVKLHSAQRIPYGQGYKPGDIVGFYIYLPEVCP
jgi:Set1/Ash2 histone methyltransferase complex subunit ASH2